MKKYILMLAVASTAALFACGGNKEAQTEEAVEPEAVEVVEEVEDTTCCAGDSVCCDTVVAAEEVVAE